MRSPTPSCGAWRRAPTPSGLRRPCGTSSPGCGTCRGRSGGGSRDERRRRRFRGTGPRPAGGRRRPDIRARVDWHRAEGHELVLVSASPELYVAPIGRRLGFDEVLATRLEVDAAGLLTGRLVGANCRGPEKVARLRAWRGDALVV